MRCPRISGAAISRGHAKTADLATTFNAVCDDIDQMHVYGRCAHCDRLAMAMKAAREAFRMSLGEAAETLECRQ